MVRTDILQATGYANVRALDLDVASRFDVSPLAVRSARNILEQAAKQPSPLRQAIDRVFDTSPEYTEPVGSIARYLGTFIE